MRKGIHINQLPYNNLSIIGVLMSSYFPSTIVYSDDENNPFIVEWLDVNDEDQDKYVIYKTSPELLKKFIDKKINHLELINNCIDGILIEFLDNLENYESFYVLGFDFLDKNSLPKQNSFFDSSISSDLDLIINHFSLADLELEEDDDLENLALQYDSDIIRIHFENSGQVVNHGSIDTTVLGNLLVCFNNLYQEVARDRFNGVDRNRYRNSVKKKFIFNNFKNTKVLVSEAASFAIYIKPQSSEVVISNDLTLSSKDIISDIFELFENSKNSSSLNEIKESHNKSVFRELNFFSEKVFEFGLSFDLKFFNHINFNKSSKKISLLDSEHINRNIKEIVETRQETLVYIGHFCSLNIDTGYYTFLTNLNKKIKGYISDFLFDDLNTFNFITIYKIEVTKNSFYNLNKLKNRNLYTIESCEINN